MAGEKDDWTPPAGCIEARSSGVNPGAELQIISYSNARHGFDQPHAARKIFGHTIAYSREATADSRKKYLEFFKKYLTPEPKASPVK
ncbi:dienelactone hydrolase family protein [Bradyrhizobium sp. TZ2]